MTRAQKTERPPDGSLSSHNGFSLISNEKLLEIYSTMLKCRMLDERIHALHEQAGKLEKGLGNSIHVAAITGAAIDVLPGDKLAPSLGAFAPCFIKGVPLNVILSSILGCRHAPRPKYSARNLVPPLLSASKQLQRVLEAAKVCKAKRNKNVVIAFSSNASGAETEFENALMLAGKKKLPILFVREISSGADERVQRMKEYGFPGVAVEYDDAIAVYRVATEALAHARRGNGPTLIECKPWPFDDRESGNRALAKHSISKMETYLAGKGLYSRKFKTRLIADFNGELDAAIKAAIS